VQAGWGIAATMAGTVWGGVLFARLGMEPLAVAVFKIAGAIGQLDYWRWARFGAVGAGVLVR